MTYHWFKTRLHSQCLWHHSPSLIPRLHSAFQCWKTGGWGYHSTSPFSKVMIIPIVIHNWRVICILNLLNLYIIFMVLLQMYNSNGATWDDISFVFPHDSHFLCKYYTSLQTPNMFRSPQHVVKSVSLLIHRGNQELSHNGSVESDLGHEEVDWL